MSAYAMPRILLFLGAVVALAGSSCLDKIPKSGSLMGGYRRIDNPESNDIVKGIVAQGIDELNRNDNSSIKYESAGIAAAYKQVVSGTNYCVQYRANGNDCDPDTNSCQVTDELLCVVAAYQALGASSADIDESSQSCEAY